MHHNDLYDSVKTACLERLVLDLNAKMSLANQTAAFLNFDISKTIGGIKLIFYMQVHIF